MSEKHQDRLIQELSQDFNDPPATPREEIWARIERRRLEEKRTTRWRIVRSPWLWVPTAAAAALLIGIMIGRDTLRQEAEQAVAEYKQELSAENARTLFELAATPYLNRAEILLTQYNSASVSGGSNLRIASWADELLVETRLLLDSPAAQDAELKELLQDMELVLVRIKRAGSGQTLDQELAHQSIETKDLLLRLRARIPAGDIGYPGA